MAAARRLPSVSPRSGVSPRSFLAPRTVAASGSRRCSTARSCRLSSCRSRVHPLRRVSEIRLGCLAVAADPPKRDGVLRLGFAPRPVGRSTSSGGPARRPRSGSRRVGAGGARSTSPRGGPSGANRSVGWSSPRGRGEVSTPVDFDRCVQLTIRFSKLGARCLGSLHHAPTRGWDARIHAGTSLRRARSPRTGVSSRRFLRSVPLVSRRHPLRTGRFGDAGSVGAPPACRETAPGVLRPPRGGADRSRLARVVTRWPRRLPPASRERGRAPCAQDTFPVPNPFLDRRLGRGCRRAFRERNGPRRARTVLQCQPTQGTIACLRPAPPLGRSTGVDRPRSLTAPASLTTAGAAL